MKPYTQAFAPITAVVQERLRSLPRCAAELWQWLRRQAKPGTPVEFNLKDFCEEFNYKVRWAAACLARLVEAELVSRERQWWGRWYRCFVADPGRNDAADSIPLVSTGSPNAQKTASNPHDSEPSIKENKDSNAEPPSDWEENLLRQRATGIWQQQLRWNLDQFKRFVVEQFGLVRLGLDEWRSLLPLLESELKNRPG